MAVDFNKYREQIDRLSPQQRKIFFKEYQKEKTKETRQLFNKTVSNAPSAYSRFNTFRSQQQAFGRQTLPKLQRRPSSQFRPSSPMDVQGVSDFRELKGWGFEGPISQLSRDVNFVNNRSIPSHVGNISREVRANSSTNGRTSKVNQEADFFAANLLRPSGFGRNTTKNVSMEADKWSNIVP